MKRAGASPVPAPPPPVFLSVDDVARRWGKDRSQVWRLIDQKRLPAYNFATTPRRASWSVKLSDLEAYESTVRTC